MTITIQKRVRDKTSTTNLRTVINELKKICMQVRFTYGTVYISISSKTNSDRSNILKSQVFTQSFVSQC